MYFERNDYMGVCKCPCCGEHIVPSPTSRAEEDGEQRHPFTCEGCGAEGEVLFTSVSVYFPDSDYYDVAGEVEIDCPSCGTLRDDTGIGSDSFDVVEGAEIATYCYSCPTCGTGWIDYEFDGIWVDDATIPKTDE